MLAELQELRDTLDEVMCKCLHRRIIVYGNDRTARFLRWYAKYYHNLVADYVITLDETMNRSYEPVWHQANLFKFNYRDVKDAVVWVSRPADDKLRQYLESFGYIEGENWFDFSRLVYGEDLRWPDNESTDPFEIHKTGARDIQFLEYLEWKHNCNFVQAIDSSLFEVAGEHGASFRAQCEQELYPILDMCHCNRSSTEAAFDFGCGKGGIMVNLLDYGFDKVGGVEYEPKIYRTLCSNFEKLNYNDKEIELLEGDASNLTMELDSYQWFIFFIPFDETITRICVDNISESIKRVPRKCHLIFFAPIAHRYLEEKTEFRLKFQMEINSRVRIVDVFESI